MRGSILRPIFDGIAAKIRIGRQIEGIPRRAVGQLPMFNRDAILKAPCAHPHPFPNMVAAHRTRTEMQDAVRVVRKDLIDRHDRNVTSVAQRCTAASVGLRSEEHTSELHSLMRISYAVYC